jgi:hypothetical protein
MVNRLKGPTGQQMWWVAAGKQQRKNARQKRQRARTTVNRHEKAYDRQGCGGWRRVNGNEKKLDREGRGRARR